MPPNPIGSCCTWRFIVSEGDFKVGDVTMGRPFSLDSVEFIVDFTPHKYVFVVCSTRRPQPFIPPPHICNVLFPTPGGRLMMQDNIQFVDMCNVMMNADPEKEEKLQDRRAALWALSNIAVLSRGVAFIRVEAGNGDERVGERKNRLYRRDYRHCRKRLFFVLPRELPVSSLLYRRESGAPPDD